MLTADRQKDARTIPLDDANTGSCRIAHTAVLQGTGDLAQPTARTFFRIGNKDSRIHESISFLFGKRPQITDAEPFKYFQL